MSEFNVFIGRWFDRILLLTVLLMQIVVFLQWRESAPQIVSVAPATVDTFSAQSEARTEALPYISSDLSTDTAPTNGMEPVPTDAMENVARLQSAVQFHRGWDLLNASPSLDMRYTKNGYLVTFSIPDVHPDELGVILDGRILTVRALCRASEHPGFVRHFERRVLLPGPVGAPEDAQADLTNGVLRVHIPKGTDYSLHSVVMRLF